MQRDFDAIIIGAGPAGSSAAILLAQAGWSVAVLEKQPFPRRKVCGECLAASNLPLLDALGIGKTFAELAGPPLTKVALMHATGSIHAPLPRLNHARHQWGRALGREHLDAILLQRAAQMGVSILQPWKAHGIQGGPGNYQCAAVALESKDEAVLKAPVLIAAHGSWEPVLDLYDEERPHDPSDLFAFKANFAGARLEKGLLPVLAFPGGYGGMVVADQHLTTVACCIRRDRLHAWRKHIRAESAGAAVETYLMAHCAGVRDALNNAQRQGRWLGIGPIRPGIRMPRYGNKLFVIGNAAGEAHPIIGEGMSMALQSAWLLCERLLAEPRILEEEQVYTQVLQRYAHAWHGNFARRIHLAAICAHLAMRPALSQAFLPFLKAWPGMMTHAANWSGKVRQLQIVPPPTGRKVRDGRQTML